MKTILITVLSLGSALTLGAQEPEGQDPLGNQLFPPQFIMAHADGLGLTNEQRQAIRDAVESVHPKISAKAEGIKTETRALVELLAGAKVDRAAALAQLGKLSGIEAEAKALHFALLIEVRNQLSADQLQQLRRVHRQRELQGSPKKQHALEKRLHGKAERIREAVQRRVENNDPPHEVAELMNQVSTMMQAGRVDDAEAVMDQALKMLGLDPGEAGEPEPKADQPSGQVRPKRPDLKAIEGPLKSPAEIRSGVAALKEQEPDWRQIEWETSLVRGLERSRKENKPVILWVFIDRPVDDKRC